MATPSAPDLLNFEGDSKEDFNASALSRSSSDNERENAPPTSLGLDTGSGYFEGKDGVQLFEQWWCPAQPKAVVAVIHGYSEHSGRYAHVAETFVKSGYAVYAYDHRSHGHSDGSKTFISSFDDVVDELELFLKHIEPRVGTLPLFVLGHSMGGLIVSLYMAIRQPSVNGVILTSPYVEIGGDVPSWLISISSFVGRWLPHLPTIGLDYNLISRDKDILAKHRADPHIYRGKLPARTGAEMNRAVQQINSIIEQINMPLLVMHGGDDQIAPVNGSKNVYARASSSDKSIKIYDGLYHEILNEVEREEVKADIVAWMNERL